jgi:hypothetical protein
MNSTMKGPSCGPWHPVFREGSLDARRETMSSYLFCMSYGDLYWDLQRGRATGTAWRGLGISPYYSIICSVIVIRTYENQYKEARIYENQ